ncbi:MAG: hypothetical protein RIS69_544 [Actinomycetota bacterium]
MTRVQNVVRKLAKVFVASIVGVAAVAVAQIPSGSVSAAAPNQPEIADIVIDEVAETVSVYFNPPVGGDPADRYRISACSGDIDKSSTVSPIVLTFAEVCSGYGGLASFRTQNPRASVYFTLKAGNGTGYGTASTSIEVYPYYISAPVVTAVTPTKYGCMVYFDFPRARTTGATDLSLLAQDEQDSNSALIPPQSMGQTSGRAYIQRQPTGYGPALLDGKVVLRFTGVMPFDGWFGPYPQDARGVGSAEIECTEDGTLTPSAPSRPTLNVIPGNNSFTLNWNIASSGSTPIEKGYIKIIQLQDDQGGIPDPYAQTPTFIDQAWVETNCISNDYYSMGYACSWLNGSGRVANFEWTDQTNFTFRTSGSIQLNNIYDPQTGQFSTPIVNGRTYMISLWVNNFDEANDNAGISQAVAYTVVNPAASPTVTSVNPTSGSTTGGTAITITGTNFVSGATVTVGGSACTSVTVVSATSITCTTPPGTAGTASIVVTAGGQSNVANTLFTYNAPTTTTTPSTSAPATTAPATAAPVGPVNVTSSNQATLTQTPGAATAVVNGQPVTVAVETPADLPAAQVDPEDRSPAQVAALQTAADNLVSQLNQSAGGNSGLAVQDTPTGAAITGLLDKPVPIENTVLVEAGTKSTLFAALNQDGSVTEVQPGAVIEVLGDGQVGVVASGLTPGETAEFVIMSTPTLLGSYTVSANGTMKAQTSLPDGIGLGNHTLVVASPTVQASLGLKVSATPSTLPATGASSSNTMQIALFLMVGGLMVAFLRRRRHILN